MLNGVKQVRLASRKVLSLFSSAGIGELGVKASGLDVVLSNEMLPDRWRGGAIDME